MSAPQIIGTSPAAPVVRGQFYRAVFTSYPFPGMWAGDNAATVGATLYEQLRAASWIDYVTPINAPTPLPGASVVTIDMQSFTPSTPVTVADFAGALNQLTLSASLYSLALVQQSDAIGGAAETSRDNATQQAAAFVTTTSFFGQLGDQARWVVVGLLIVVALMVALAAHRVLREI
jgi:hypothetical protein